VGGEQDTEMLVASSPLSSDQAGSSTSEVWDSSSLTTESSAHSDTVAGSSSGPAPEAPGTAIAAAEMGGLGK
jgi:hypothetical protein